MRRTCCLLIAPLAAVLVAGSDAASAQETPAIGMVISIEGSGSRFEVTDGTDTHITLDSSEPVAVTIDAVAGVLNMMIEAAEGAASADLTLTGLAAGATYYKYEDDYHNGGELITDGSGTLAYTQDLAEPHLVMLQRQRGTRFIPSDPTIGVWDPATRVYTLTTDLAETIQIDESNMTLDGGRHRIALPPPMVPLSSGIYLAGKTGVTVKNVNVDGFFFGCRLNACSHSTVKDNILVNGNMQIYMHSNSSHNTVRNNVLADMNPSILWGYGVWLRGSCIYNTLTGNTTDGNWVNCFIESSSDHNTVSDTVMSNSPYCGCLIQDYSRYNTVHRNILTNNEFGCAVLFPPWVPRASHYNTVYGNNFLENVTQAEVGNGCYENVFNLALPEGGNHWDNWTGPDGNGDGFVDQAYSFTNGADYYPRVQPYDLNNAPVAAPGEPQTAYRGELVTLDGTGSFDPDADHPLSYWWYLNDRPAGSEAILVSPFTSSPTLTPDLLGEYVVYLVVVDSTGMMSLPDSVVVSTENAPPVAYAGDDQALLKAGTTVALGDEPNVPGYDPDGDDVSFLWSISERPDGSGATLNDEEAVWPTFVADVYGTYVVELIVIDALGAVSDPDSVTISCENLPPAADAGFNQAAVVGDTIYLDGSASYDANEDALTYSWSFAATPPESTAVLNTPDQVTADFVTDVPGTYVVSLVVNDGLLDSTPSNATIEVITVYDAAVETAMAVIEEANNLPPEVLVNKNMRNPLTNKVNAVLSMMEEGQYQQALDKLANDILAKTDGCALTGAPDQNDWLTTCEAQDVLYPFVIETMAYLEGLLAE